MAATKVYRQNNLLIIEETGQSKIRLISTWVSMAFSDAGVFLKDHAGTNNTRDVANFFINFNDFQDDQETPINTEETIATYLSDKIG